VTRPGLIIYRFSAPLYFANANVLHEQAEQLVKQAGEPVEWFVLDAEAISDIDTTGAEALGQTVEDLRQAGVIFAISRANSPVPELLRTYKLIEEIGEEYLFVTNRDAVAAFYQETGQPVSTPVTAGSSHGRAGDRLNGGAMNS
jgi:MFS superfamily sulfate permease-like transporter